MPLVLAGRTKIDGSVAARPTVAEAILSLAGLRPTIERIDQGCEQSGTAYGISYSAMISVGLIAQPGLLNLRVAKVVAKFNSPFSELMTGFSSPLSPRKKCSS
ncbi:hypothetical protein [Pelobacter seleniigenes]|uniref:hypothetical protein n=1 Tax=Pelobacter seleniigenes TaxID=407188 RepID=UPI0012B71D30|nr:hypothetical protein [Pelobacter seleniigenes]